MGARLRRHATSRASDGSKLWVPFSQTREAEKPERVLDGIRRAAHRRGTAGRVGGNCPPSRAPKQWGTPDAFGPADALFPTTASTGGGSFGTRSGAGAATTARRLNQGSAPDQPRLPPPLRHRPRRPSRPRPRPEHATAHGSGGIVWHDHIGGGFARYSVDEKWHVPHFEKMLYDNAQLAGTFARPHGRHCPKRPRATVPP